MLRAVLMLVGGAGFWILCVAGIKPEEMIVGAISVALTFAFTWFVASKCFREMEFRFRDVFQGWRLPIYLITGTGEILSVLVTDLLHLAPAESLFRAARFVCGKQPFLVARRVLAIAYTTATPNFIILGIDPDSQQMLFHQLKKSDVLTMTRNLGAQG